MLDIKITRTTSPKEKPQDETKLGFGKKFTDHMFVMDYTEGEAGTMPASSPMHPSRWTRPRWCSTMRRRSLRA